MAIFSMKSYNGGLLSLGDDDQVLESSIDEMSPAEEIQAQADSNEFAEEGSAVEEQIAALESMDDVVSEGEAQVIQNEVNEAAMQGETVPEDATVVSTITPEESGSSDPIDEVVAVSEGEVPAPTITSESTPAEVGVEAIKLRDKLTNFGYRLKIGNAEDLASYLGVNNGIRGGCESILSNPIESYKEGCLGFKETLVKYKNKVLAFLQRVGQTIVRWFKKFVNACKMTKRRAKNLKEKLKAMSASDYKLKENYELKLSAAWVYGYDKTGKGYITERAKHVEEVIKKIKSVSDKVLTGKEDPKTVNEKAIKLYGESDGVTSKLWKTIVSVFKLVNGTKSINTNDVKIFLPVDHEKAYTYSKFEGNTDSMDGFPRLQTLKVQQNGLDSKSIFGGEAKSRIDVAMNLCNSVIEQSDATSKKMDDAAKYIEKFKSDINNMVKGGGGEGEGLANKNYAVRRSITVASDMFKVSYVYGLIPGQALSAAYDLVASLEKKESK